MPRLKNIIGPVLGIVLLLIAVYVLVHKLRDFTLAELIQGVEQVRISHLLAAFALTAAYYVITTWYDALAFAYIKHPLPYRRIALASFVAYAFSHNVGLSMISSGSMRYRIYSSFGLTAANTAKIVVFCGVSVWLGLLMTAGVLYSLAPIPIPDFVALPFHSVRPIGIAALALVAVYGWFAIRNKRGAVIWKLHIPHLTGKIFTAQLITGLLDWCVGALVVYVLLPKGVHIPFHLFLEFFLLAQMSGLVSQVPGGIGVFESILLLLLPETVPTSHLLASFLLYRMVFYIVPLIVGTMLLATHEVSIGRLKEEKI